MVNLSHLLIKDEVGGGLDFFKKGVKDQGRICWHYNGGWMRRVTGLDKSKDTGFSILGDNVSKYEQQAWQEPGLYLDCCIEGSKGKPFKYYSLFELRPDGEVWVLTTSKGADWAVQMWPTIEDFFSSTEPEMPLDEMARGKRQFALIGAADAILKQYAERLQSLQGDSLLSEETSIKATNLLADIEKQFHELNLAMAEAI